MNYIRKLYSIFISYSFIYIFYTSCSLLFFLIYLFLSKLYIFNGDIYHGISSYLLILHSSLAISSNFFYYLLVCFSLYYYFYYRHYKDHIKNIYNITYLLSLYIIYHISLFILTGMIWSDYSWGFFVPIEYRIIKLLSLLILYCLYCISYKFMSNVFVYLNMAIIFLMLLLFVFDFFVLNSLNSTFEIHQNDSSLHLFLISISGSYMFTITLLILYLFLLIIYIAIAYLYTNLIFNKKYINTFYNKNIFIRKIQI